MNLPFESVAIYHLPNLDFYWREKPENRLLHLVGDLHKLGIQFKSVTDAIDTSTPSGRFFFEMARELTVERTRAGMEVANSISSPKKLLASGQKLPAIAVIAFAKRCCCSK
jgi:hypothetical protein